jgi:hypothetical protein
VKSTPSPEDGQRAPLPRKGRSPPSRFKASKGCRVRAGAGRMAGRGGQRAVNGTRPPVREPAGASCLARGQGPGSRRHPSGQARGGPTGRLAFESSGEDSAPPPPGRACGRPWTRFSARAASLTGPGRCPHPDRAGTPLGSPPPPARAAPTAGRTAPSWRRQRPARARTRARARPARWCGCVAKRGGVRGASPPPTPQQGRLTRGPPRPPARQCPAPRQRRRRRCGGARAAGRRRSGRRASSASGQTWSKRGQPITRCGVGWFAGPPGPRSDSRPVVKRGSGPVAQWPLLNRAAGRGPHEAAVGTAGARALVRAN